MDSRPANIDSLIKDSVGGTGTGLVSLPLKGMLWMGCLLSLGIA